MGSARLLRNLDDLPRSLRRGALAIGNFDGVHRGHAAIARRLVARAAQLPGAAVVFSFDPHPAQLLRPQQAPAPLTRTEYKAELLGALGVDAVVAYPTDRAVLDLTAEQFFYEMVVRRLEARAMVEGPNFFFGRNRGGSIDLLGRLCHQAGITLEIVHPLVVGRQYVSSSRVRQLIRAGQVRQAAQLLGRPYRVQGQVVMGAKRGREIGFPTANLQPMGMLVPPQGVYAGRAGNKGQHFPAAIHLGPNPTFAEAQTKLEIHLVGFQGDLYGQQLDVDFLEKIRDVRPFTDAQQLVGQLRQDVQAAKAAERSARAQQQPEP